MIGSGMAMATTSAGITPSAPVQPGVARRPGSTPPAANGNVSVGGVMSGQSLGSMQSQAKDAAESAAAAEKEQAQPGIAMLAGHIKAFWELAKEAKRPVEDQMLEALYARRGEYTAAKLATIQAAGQPAIYMMLAASKMRQVGSLLHDTLIGAGTEKPWTLEAEPVPELPPLLVAQIKAALTQELETAINAGADPTLEDVRQRMMAVKEQELQRVREEARAGCERMEDKMETQLDEGGFNDALDQFITDITTFKTAFIAGPIVRKKPKLTWVAGNATPVVKTVESLEFERISPFDMYPAPWARTIAEGPFIRKHKLTRESLTEMDGVDGFSSDSIKRVLDLYGTGGLNEWLSIDSELARAEGKLTSPATMTTGLIDALQYWGSVSGKMLREWGMTAKQVPDEAKEYSVEAWLIGPYVIKAALNVDPLARRPFYATSYERVPGSVWGNCPFDLMADCQDMCNAAARSLAANLGISSGPQVVVNTSRLAPGESITSMYPWKIWQVEADPMGNVAPPITFFQPSSNAAELMGVYEKFSTLADEYTGIPRYMTGNEGTPGAGRTASGLSMMIGNASKIIKQVIGSIDLHILSKLIERLYYYNMRYAKDPDLKRAVNVIARGAMSLTTKEAAQVRRNEFLAATNNPTDIAIIGTEGRAEVLRSVVQTLDMNPDKIVPPLAVLKEKQKLIQAAQAAAAAAAQEQPGAGLPGVPTPGTGGAPGTPGNMPPQAQPGQQLTNGAPVTDHFQPPQGAPA